MSNTALMRIASSRSVPIKRGVVLVVWAERDENVVRIISAWWATKAEQQLYEEFLVTIDV